MTTSLKRASSFLEDIQQLGYYSVLTILNEMQDTFLKEQKGQKEILFIDQVIQSLSRTQDTKITYSNGFHVNHAHTAIHLVDVEGSSQ